MIRKATLNDLHTVAALALALWPDNEPGELENEFEGFLTDPEIAVFLYAPDHASADTFAGFAQCGLRRDYVEGTESSPVGYLEGVYVQDGYRHQGAARVLVTACEAWAREKGCTEFASDCELDNTASLAFHLACGFEEANRIICFTKSL